MRRLKRHVKHGIVALNDHNAKDETNGKQQTRQLSDNMLS